MAQIKKKNVFKNFLNLPEWDANPDPDSRIRTRQKFIKSRNAYNFGRDPDLQIALKLMRMSPDSDYRDGFKNFYADPRFA